MFRIVKPNINVAKKQSRIDQRRINVAWYIHEVAAVKTDTNIERYINGDISLDECSVRIKRGSANNGEEIVQKNSAIHGTTQNLVSIVTMVALAFRRSANVGETDDKGSGDATRTDSAMRV